jgi:DNA-binding NarL/FixJ family response regulator
MGTVSKKPSQLRVSGHFGPRAAVTRILIADDHEVVRAGVRGILEDHPGWHIVAEALDGKQAVDKSIAEKPDVAILDYSLPMINGVEATRQIRARAPSVEILIFTMHDNEILMRDMLQAGARGYLLKSDAGEHLISAVQALAAHRPFFTSKASEALLESYLTTARQSEHLLTARERGIVQLVAEGHSNKQIANLLGISIKTVETHRATIMRKLNLTSSAALVRYAVRHKIVEP